MNYIYKSIAAGKLVGIVDKKVLAVAIFFVIAFFLAINNSMKQNKYVNNHMKRYVKNLINEKKKKRNK